MSEGRGFFFIWFFISRTHIYSLAFASNSRQICVFRRHYADKMRIFPLEFFYFLKINKKKSTRKVTRTKDLIFLPKEFPTISKKLSIFLCVLWCAKWTTMSNERRCPHIHKKSGRDVQNSMRFVKLWGFNHVLDNNVLPYDDIWTKNKYVVQETTFPMSDNTGILGHFFQKFSERRHSFGTPE